MKIPKMVFKFKSLKNIKYALDIINKSEIYLPNREELNDPLEGTSFCVPLGIMGHSIHYADNYSGICYGFSTKRTFNNLFPVHYVINKMRTEFEDIEPKRGIRRSSF